MTRPTLATAELAVMELLWLDDELTARQIMEAIYPDATRAQHGTVQRLLHRLEEKGFVARDRTEHLQRFSARVSRAEYACDALESLADKLAGGSLAPLITHLVEEKKLTPDEIARLRRLLEES